MSSGFKWDSDIYVTLLNLNPRQNKHVLPCPFHVDSDPSLSVDLQKAVHFCHGGCKEPKGGGPVAFLKRWERIKNGKEITSQEAARRLRSTFKIPDARKILREAMLAEVQRFADHIVLIGAGARREFDRCLAALTERGRLRPLSETEWDDLAFFHRERQWWDERWYACHGVRNITLLARYFKEAREIGLWSDELYTSLIIQDEQRAASEHSIERKRWREMKLDTLQWATQEVTKLYAKRSLCRQPITKTPIPKRTPVHKRTPVA
jgi:hypothetical protein